MVSAEAVNNMCGLGFNGYDENGKAKWNRVTNVNILKVEVIFSFFFFHLKVNFISCSLTFVLFKLGYLKDSNAAAHC